MATPVARVPGKSYVVGTPTIKHRLAVVVGIDLTAVAVTPLFTTPAGFTAVITDLYLQVTASAAPVTPPTAGAGVAAGEDDVFPSVALTGLLAINDVWPFALANSKGVVVPAAATLNLGVDVGAAAGTLTATAQVYGFMF